VVMGTGFALLSLLDAGSTRGQTTLAMVIAGAGLGLLVQNLALVVQNAVPSRHMGIATSLAQFARVNDEYVDRNRLLVLWSSAFSPLLQGLVGLGFVAVLWYGGSLVLRGTLTIGEFVTFNFFLGKLVWPMIAIGWVISLAQRGAASFGRIREVLDTAPTVRDEEPLVHVERVAGRVEARELTFRYREELTPALRDVSFAAEAGQTIALVGRTGSGKSTLLSLIPRMWDPPEGTLRDLATLEV